MRDPSRRVPFGRSAVVMVALIGLLAGACSGGGDPGTGEDLGVGPGETVLQFDGAAKLRMGGTLAMPANAGDRAPSPGC